MITTFSRRAVLVLLFVGVLFASGSSAVHADANPSVTSFVPSASAIGNNYSIGFNWTVTNGAGASILFSCPLGVAVKDTNGTSVCGTRQTLSGTNSGAVAYAVANVSGVTQSVPVVLYPKDSGGTDYDAGAVSASFTVTTSVQPITDFSISTTSVTSGSSAAVSWTSVDVPGVNLQFDCTNNVQISTSQGGPTLPCNTPAFSSSLAQSGSQTLYFTSSSDSSIQMTARIFPAIASGVYDATHARSVTFAVLPKSAPVLPSVSSFTLSSAALLSGAPLTLSWSVQNGSGANLQFSCNSSVVVQSTQSGATTTLPCGVPAFAVPLGTSGSVSVFFSNGNPFSQSASVALLPQDSSGIYYGTQGKSLSFTVYPIGYVAAAAAASSTPVPAASSTVSTGASASSGGQKISVLLSAPLSKGSRGAQVSALQTYLAQNSTIYPEGLVTGYFGQATEMAVERFQEKYGLAVSGDAGYGFVGPKTRAKINSLQGTP